MASWSSKRKSLYFLLFIAIIAVLIGIPAYKFFYVAPTCFDNQKNGDEQGVDCGGSCTKLCTNNFIAIPSASWVRFVETGPKIYNIAAYIINPNKNATASNIPYKLSVLDRDGVSLIEMNGFFNLPVARNTVVFKSNVSLSQKPARAIIEFPHQPEEWKLDTDRLSAIEVTDKNYTEDENGSSLDVKIRNGSTKGFDNIAVYAILKDADGNVVDFSKTVLDTVPAMSSVLAPFTWPTSHNGKAVSIEVLSVQQ